MSNTLQFRCSSCQVMIKAATTKIGHTIACPRCKQHMQVPANSDAPASAPVAAPVASAAKPIAFRCPGCSTVHKVPAEQAGSRIVCSCGKKLQVPARKDPKPAPAPAAEGSSFDLALSAPLPPDPFSASQIPPMPIDPFAPLPAFAQGPQFDDLPASPPMSTPSTTTTTPATGGNVEITFHVSPAALKTLSRDEIIAIAQDIVGQGLRMGWKVGQTGHLVFNREGQDFVVAVDNRPEGIVAFAGRKEEIQLAQST